MGYYTSMQGGGGGGVVAAAVVVIVAAKLWQLIWALFWRPYALTKFFRNQGIRGPPYHFFYGSLKEVKDLKRAATKLVLDNSSNDITPRILPHYEKWFPEYGETLLYWHGLLPRVTVTDPELVKQILSNKFGFYVKPKFRPSLVIGKGLVLLDGPQWASRRRLLNPAFSMEKLKPMMSKIGSCTLEMVSEWEKHATEGGCIKIEANSEFKRLTADIISHTAFGSSYLQGKEAFQALQQLQRHSAAKITDVFIPGSQYIPTPSNMEIWKLDRKLKKSLMNIVENKVAASKSGNSGGYGDDLLGMMLEASETTKGAAMTTNEIMDECKTFFFAGHETTSNLLTWAIFLLTIHKEWQQKLRDEVLRECDQLKIPDADSLSKLKLVNLVLLETLRLYSPAIELVRMASEDMKLGELEIPKGTILSIPILKIHSSKETWGDDAKEFNPMRFVNGVSMAATHPNAFLAFAMGPRVCIGQNFAMMEAKSVLALLLQRFSFTLSPEYKHAPTNNLTLQPQYGLPVLVKPLHV